MSSHDNNTPLNVGNSQSRIKVNLSQKEDHMGMTGMQDELDVMQPKPTLMAEPFRSDGSTPAPMREMDQMEV